MSNPLSRFQPIPRPVTAPGHCYLCRGINGPFIHTGVNVKFEGLIIICHVCVKEMFKQLDLEVVKNQAEFDEHGAKRFAEGAAVGQNYVLESLRDFVGEFVPADYSPAPVASGSVDPVEDSERVSEDTGDTIEVAATDSRESGESGDSTDGDSVESPLFAFSAGRDDLSSDSSDGAKSFGI